MSGKIAVRNVRLCEKDCLCLYVCPTGASDTENSVIDADKCTGCGACAEACPAGAISLVPREYPPQQTKTDGVAAALSSTSKDVSPRSTSSACSSSLDNPRATCSTKAGAVPPNSKCDTPGSKPSSPPVSAGTSEAKTLAGVPFKFEFERLPVNDTTSASFARVSAT